MPGNRGGSNWGTTSANPPKGMVYVLSVDAPAILKMNAEQPRISSEVWHIDPTAETDIDLYASDVVHTRFNALRGLLVGLVDGSGFTDSPLVFWNEHGGRIQSLSVTRTPPLDNWGEQQQVRSARHRLSCS